MNYIVALLLITALFDSYSMDSSLSQTNKDIPIYSALLANQAASFKLLSSSRSNDDKTYSAQEQLQSFEETHAPLIEAIKKVPHTLLDKYTREQLLETPLTFRAYALLHAGWYSDTLEHLENHLNISLDEACSTIIATDDPIDTYYAGRLAQKQGRWGLADQCLSSSKHPLARLALIHMHQQLLKNNFYTQQKDQESILENIIIFGQQSLQYLPAYQKTLTPEANVDYPEMARALVAWAKQETFKINQLHNENPKETITPLTISEDQIQPSKVDSALQAMLTAQELCQAKEYTRALSFYRKAAESESKYRWDLGTFIIDNCSVITSKNPKGLFEEGVSNLINFIDKSGNEITPDQLYYVLQALQNDTYYTPKTMMYKKINHYVTMLAGMCNSNEMLTQKYDRAIETCLINLYANKESSFYDAQKAIELLRNHHNKQPAQIGIIDLLLQENKLDEALCECQKILDTPYDSSDDLALDTHLPFFTKAYYYQAWINFKQGKKDQGIDRLIQAEKHCGNDFYNQAWWQQNAEFVDQLYILTLEYSDVTKPICARAVQLHRIFGKIIFFNDHLRDKKPHLTGAARQALEFASDYGDLNAAFSLITFLASDYEKHTLLLQFADVIKKAQDKHHYFYADRAQADRTIESYFKKIFTLRTKDYESFMTILPAAVNYYVAQGKIDELLQTMLDAHFIQDLGFDFIENCLMHKERMSTLKNMEVPHSVEGAIIRRALELAADVTNPLLNASIFLKDLLTYMRIAPIINEFSSPTDSTAKGIALLEPIYKTMNFTLSNIVPDAFNRRIPVSLGIKLARIYHLSKNYTKSAALFHAAYQASQGCADRFLQKLSTEARFFEYISLFEMAASPQEKNKINAAIDELAKQVDAFDMPSKCTIALLIGLGYHYKKNNDLNRCQKYLTMAQKRGYSIEQAVHDVKVERALRKGMVRAIIKTKANARAGNGLKNGAVIITAPK